VRCHANCSRGVRRATSFTPAGFSLIELLIVLALMIILVTLYWGHSSPSRQKQDQTLCEQNLQKIYVAMEIFANDHHGRFPEIADAKTAEEPLDLLVPHYTVDTSIFICPGSKDSTLPAGESILKRRISYAYYMGWSPADKAPALMSDRQINTLPRQANEEVFSSTGKPPGNNHYSFGGNFLFCDGHVELSPAHVPFPLAWPASVQLLNPKP
jgi:prepilin-type processing-associated H-X9-DG protein/prepilin-type N-terminal cleavage/methylation domain-containing protein